MEIYLLKSAACMAIFLIFYKLLLERENMHVFKRFYLLLAIGASLAIPGVVFTEYVVVEPVVYQEVQQPLVTDYIYTTVPETSESYVLDVEPILWTLYFLGFAFFGFKFIKNLIQIVKRIRKNPKQKVVGSIRVLLKENFPPHTFFKYIFLNKKRLESNEIPKEVLLHEETHARQKHSFDVVFIELMQVVFWFNPLVYLFKKAIKLNHEFLADQAVLDNEVDQTTYQNTLLSYLSTDSEKKYQLKMANSINYSSIKKRFTVMKTRTSKKSVLLRTLIILPLIALLVLGFSQTELITVEETQNRTSIQDITIEIKNDGTLLFEKESSRLEEISRQAASIFKDLKRHQIRNFVTANILYDENHLDLISKIEAELRSLGIEKIHHISKKTASILGETGIKPSKYDGKTIDEARAIRKDEYLQQMLSDEENSTSLEIVSIEIKKGKEIWFKNEPLSIETLLEKINSSINKKAQKTDFIVQIYSYGVLKSELINRITKELRKIGAKQIQVYSEEYIMQEDEYQDSVPITPSTVRLWADKMTIESNQPHILVNINAKGQLLVDDTLVPVENLKQFLSDYHDRISADHDSKKIKSTIYIDVDSPEHIINRVYKLLNEYGEVNVQPIENGESQSETQNGVTKKQFTEYNTLAQKYNAMLSKDKSIQIKMKDVERLKYLYGLMSDKQKAKAESFPNFPPPPPAPKNIKAPNPPKNLNDKEYAEKIIEETIANQDPYDRVNYVPVRTQNGELDFVRAPNPPLPKLIYEGYEKNATGLEMKPALKKTEKIAQNKKNTDSWKYSSQIENPDRPKEFYVKQLIDLKNKNAIFYHKGKEISFYKALDLVYKKRSLVLATFKPNNSDRPISVLDRNLEQYNFKDLINSQQPLQPSKGTTILINGKSGSVFNMTKSEIYEMKFSCKEGKVNSFKIKIPGVPTQMVTGNRLNSIVKELLTSVKSNVAISIFDVIVSNKGKRSNPIIIKVKS